MDGRETGDIAALDTEKEPGGPTLTLDMDGYWTELAAAYKVLDENDGISPYELNQILDPRTRTAREELILSTYYFQVRSMVLFSDLTHAKDFSGQVQDWRERCLHLAAHLTVLNLRRGIRVEPWWTRIAKERLMPVLQLLAANLDQIPIAVDQVPRLQCRATPERTIRVSALTREAYLQLNIAMFLNMRTLKSEPDEAVRSSLRLMLPYFIQMNDSVPISRLPQGFGGTFELMRYAYNVTYQQTLFLLGHEYGHLYFGHESEKAASKTIALSREFEADEFSDAILRALEGNTEIDKALYPLAILSLLEFQQMDEIVGRMLRGQPINHEQLIFGQRRQALAATLASDDDTLLGLGTELLNKIRAKILAIGSDRLKTIADELARDATEGPHGRWWEDV